MCFSGACSEKDCRAFRQRPLQAMSNPQETVRSCSCESHWFSSGWRCYCFADELPTEFGYCNMQQQASETALTQPRVNSVGIRFAHDRGLRGPLSRIPEAECLSCPTTSTSVSSARSPSTELVGSLISAWSAHCRDVQQQELGLLRPPTPTPGSDCRICAGTGCVFCGTYGGSKALGAYYQQRKKRKGCGE